MISWPQIWRHVLPFSTKKGLAGNDSLAGKEDREKYSEHTPASKIDSDSDSDSSSDSGHFPISPYHDRKVHVGGLFVLPETIIARSMTLHRSYRYSKNSIQYHKQFLAQPVFWFFAENDRPKQKPCLSFDKVWFGNINEHNISKQTCQGHDFELCQIKGKGPPLTWGLKLR